MSERFDVLVIGSGFGGGTVALRLAQAGKRVCVLERGRRWRGKNLLPSLGDPETTPFPEAGDTHFLWGRQLWRPFRQRLGLLDFRLMMGLNALVGAGVGGGSLIWSNVVVEAPEQVFVENWPSGLNRRMLEPYYRRASAMLRPRLIPGVPGVPDREKGRVVARAHTLKMAADRTAASWRPAPVAVNFGDEHTPQPNGHGKARQLGCNYCANCNFGCPQNAKNTVDLSYIAEAESYGAELRTLHQVTAIEPADLAGYRVHYNRFDLQGCLQHSGFLEADSVVLAAGTFGTTELLLRCRQQARLPNLSPALGTRFSTNGNITGGLRHNGPAPVEYAFGPVIGGLIDYDNFVIEDLTAPDWLADFVTASNLKRVLLLLRTWAGCRPKEKKSDGMLVLGGIGRDSARGRLKLGRFNRLALEWTDGIHSEPVVAELHRRMRELSSVLGLKYVPNVLSLFDSPVTIHPLGGCPMADGAHAGVVDSFGRVYGYPGLYIADGSIVPTATGRNPAFTIAALCERIAEHMVQGAMSRG